MVTGSRILWFAQANVGLAGFVGKILVASKNLFSSKIFLDFRYIHTGTRFMYGILYICGDLCQVSKMLKKKKLEFVDNSPQSTHRYRVCIVI